MKNILLLILSTFTLKAAAQVKFSLQDSKDQKANIVYLGIPNVFKILTSQEISISKIVSSQGNVRMNSDGGFTLYVHDVSDEPVELKYTQSKNGVESEVSYPTKFIVKAVPDIYQLKIGTMTKGGKTKLQQIKLNHAVSLNTEGFDREVKNLKIQFTLMHVSPGTDPTEMLYASDAAETVKYYNNKMKMLKVGDKLFFEQIKITDAIGVSREAENLNFLITE